MTIDQMRGQNHGCKERKCLHEVGVSLVYPIGHARQRRHGLLATAGRPAITMLETDQVRVGDSNGPVQG
jgi:hypothetical protein